MEIIKIQKGGIFIKEVRHMEVGNGKIIIDGTELDVDAIAEQGAEPSGVRPETRSVYCGNAVHIDHSQVLREDVQIVCDGMGRQYVTQKTLPPIVIRVQGNIETLKAEGCCEVHADGDIGSVSSMSGDISCRCIKGNARTMSGDITAESIGGSASTMSGSIHRH